MIGFLRKDFYALTSLYKKNLALVFVLYVVLTVSTGNPFFLYFLIWMMGFYSLSAISLDQGCGWDRYARTLPSSPRQVVAARYLITVGSMAAGAALALAVHLIAIDGQQSALEAVGAVPVVTAVSIVTISIMMPAAYKWGIEKARNGFLALFAVVFAVPLLMEQGVLDDAVLTRALSWLDTVPVGLLTVSVLAAAALVCWISYEIAWRIYRKQEF